jgi:hypothetical protein
MPPLFGSKGTSPPTTILPPKGNTYWLHNFALWTFSVGTLLYLRQGLRVQDKTSVSAHRNKLRGLGLRANYTDRETAASAKLVPTFADRGCHVVSVTEPLGSILGFLDRSRYFFFQIAPQLYSRGWVDPIQIHYFSENQVALGIEPGFLDL